jgi:hypothetical protein
LKPLLGAESRDGSETMNLMVEDHGHVTEHNQRQIDLPVIVPNSHW